jgi:hypothetical protein
MLPNRRVLLVVLFNVLWTAHVIALPAAAGVSQPQPAGAGAVHLYGAYWHVGAGYSSTLMLSNGGRFSATATVTLFSHSGSERRRIEIGMPANSVRRLNLADIVTAEEDWGGLRVEFLGSTQLIAGKIVIGNTEHGSTVELLLGGGYRFDFDQALHAPWWLPDQETDGTLALFNSSARSLVVFPSIVTEGVEAAANRLVLAPYETKVLRLRSLLPANNAVVGSVALRYSGLPHALHPALLIQNENTAFSLAPTFNARHDHQVNQLTAWQFPRLALSGQKRSGPQEDEQRTYALLTNGTGNPLTPELGLLLIGSPSRQAQKVALPVVPLAPLETRLVDLSRLAGFGSIPDSVSHVALSVTHNGVPGDLAISVFSVDRDEHAVRSEGVILPAAVVESSYWDVAGNGSMHPILESPIGAEFTVDLVLLYQTSFGVRSYILPLTVPTETESQILLNLKQRLNSGIPDENGARIPPGTSSGVLALAVLEGMRNTISLGDLVPECTVECPEFSTLSVGASTANTNTASHFVQDLSAPQNSCSAPPPPPACPTSVTLSSTKQISLAANHPPYLTGMGIVAAMQTNPTTKNWNGTKITEAVSLGSGDTCPKSDDFGKCEGSDTWSVGTGYPTFFGVSLPATENIFWDAHVTATKAYSVLNHYGITSCSRTCAQTYTCNGKSVGSFTITRKFTKTTLGGQSVTLVTVTKK